MKPAKLASYLVLGTFTVILVVFLWWHWNLGLTRYFDADEYAHLHWSAQMMMGKKPYVDFLTFFPPGFAWFLTPALLAGWGSAQPFITARVMMFFVFCGMCLFSGLIFWELRRKFWGAIAAAAILSFLPLPFDKYLEIRPDNLATLLILIAVYFQIRWMDVTAQKISRLSLETKAKPWVRFASAISGLSYGLSYIVLPKMLPNIAVGFAIAALFLLQNHHFANRKDQLTMLDTAKPFLIGFGAPLLLFGLYLLTLGKLGVVIYSLSTLTLESNKISKYFIMMPFLFFYPNTTFYGQDGWSRGLITNHVIWMAALFFAVYRFFTPFLAPGGKNRSWQEVLVAATCLVQVIFYVELVPLKHTQYLIPIGVFIGWYMADLLLSVWKWTGNFRYGKIVCAGVFLFGAVYLTQVFVEGNSAKQYWSNIQSLADMQKLYDRIPKTEPVLDLDGLMLYNPDAYYACCIPFGQFAEFLSRPLPNLPTVLAGRNVKYINQGGLQRVNTLPYAWQQYIYSHYRSDNGNNTFLIRNDIQ